MIRFLPLLIFLSFVLARGAETNQFPIMPWNTPPNDLAALKKIKECGFTLAGFVAPAGLDLCEKAGLKAIFSDPRTSVYAWETALDYTQVKSNVASLIHTVEKHPAVFGFYLRDEPS